MSKLGKLVKIEWHDSRGVNHQWELLEDSEGEKICVCISVGYIIRETVEYIKIAPHITDYEDKNLQHIGSMTITQCSIRNIKEIGDYEDRIECLLTMKK